MAAHLKNGIQDLLERIQKVRVNLMSSQVFELEIKGLVSLVSFATDNWDVYKTIHSYHHGQISLWELEQHLHDILNRVVIPEWEELGCPQNREEWLGRKWWGNNPHLQPVAQSIKMLLEQGFDLSSIDLEELDQGDYDCSVEHQLGVNIFSKTYEWLYQHGFVIKSKDQAMWLDVEDYKNLTEMWKELLKDERNSNP